MPSQQLSNGFCYDKCPNGWDPSGSACLSKCPAGFTDHGTTCEPPSLLRATIKAYVEPCPVNQIEIGGNCFEPQTVSYAVVNGVQVPKVSGCGCIRRTLPQRIQCPQGYVKYNNACLPPCPTGYEDVKAADGTILSMYCLEKCPLNYGSKNDRWNFIGGQCVKEFRSRLPQRAGSTTSLTTPSDPSFRILRGVFGTPESVLSNLSKKPLGASLQNRYRAGQTLYKDLSNNTGGLQGFLPSSWIDLLENPEQIAIFGFIIVALIYAAPAIFSGIGGLIKFLLPAVGKATGAVVEGAGGVVRGAFNVASGAENVVAGIERSSAASTVGQGALAQAALQNAAASVNPVTGGWTPEMMALARSMFMQQH